MLQNNKVFRMALFSVDSLHCIKWMNDKIRHVFSSMAGHWAGACLSYRMEFQSELVSWVSYNFFTTVMEASH